MKRRGRHSNEACKLAAQLKEHDLTQGDLADLMECSLSRVNAKINGRGGACWTIPEAKKLRKILSLSNKQVIDIFFKED